MTCSPYAVGVVDDGHAIHYTALPKGIPVYAVDGTEVGRVAEVVDNFREHILDGIVIEAADGALRFVDAPEVGRTAERGVTLTITPDEVRSCRRRTRGGKLQRQRPARTPEQALRARLEARSAAES